MVNDTSYKAKLNEYMSHLKAAVDERRFDLSECSGESTVSTSRLIKPMAGWEGIWPALRELMQNTIDHLKLLGDEGALNAVLRVEHEERRKEPPAAPAAPADTQRNGKQGKAAPEEALTHEFRFVCVRPACDEVVCAITVDKDELVIEQAHTFPIHPRALGHWRRR